MDHGGESLLFSFLLSKDVLKLRSTHTLAFLFFFSTANAQILDAIQQLQPPYDQFEKQISATPDALLNTLQNNPPQSSAADTQHAQYHLLLSEAYDALTYPDEALQHAERGLTFITEAQEPWLFHRLNIAKAVALDLSGKPAQGIELASAAVVWAEQQEDRTLLIRALQCEGLIHNSLINYEEALNSLQRAYQLAPRENAIITQSAIASIIALVYEYRREPGLAIPYFEEAVEYHRKVNNALELSIALFGLGRANKDINNPELARIQLKESADVAIAINDTQGEAYALKELSGLEIAAGNYATAEQLLLRCEEIFAQANNKYLLLDTNLSLSRLSLRTKEIVKARRYIDKATTFVDPESMPMQHLTLQEQTAHVSAAEGNHEQAYQQIADIIVKKQRLAARQSVEKLHQVRSQFELEVKEQENRLLEQDIALQKANLDAELQKNRLLLILFFFTVIICALLLYLFYRSRQHKRQTTENGRL